MAIFRGKNKQSASLGVVVVAAGNASRMNGTDKQLLELGGIPVIVRSVAPFQQHAAVKEIVLVCRQEAVGKMLELVQYFELSKVSKIISGGSTRQQSVFRGVEQLGEDISYIAVHDGARPFLDLQIIERCLADVQQYQAVTAAVKAKDTIKQAGEGGIIQQTLDRERLYNTQTPQVFSRQLYLSAMKEAVAQGKDYTDDCQLIESMGQPVYLSRGSYLNIKLTTPEDVLLGEAIAGMMESLR